MSRGTLSQTLTGTSFERAPTTASGGWHPRGHSPHPPSAQPDLHSLCLVGSPSPLPAAPPCPPLCALIYSLAAVGYESLLQHHTHALPHHAVRLEKCPWQPLHAAQIVEYALQSDIHAAWALGSLKDGVEEEGQRQASSSQGQGDLGPFEFRIQKNTSRSTSKNEIDMSKTDRCNQKTRVQAGGARFSLRYEFCSTVS